VHLNRLPVVVLGATGMVGQRMLSLLDGHPGLRLVGVGASARSVGRPLAEALTWRLPGRLPRAFADLPVLPCEPRAFEGQARLALSALDAGPAGPIEAAFRDAGWWVVTNASPWRMDPGVPLVIPEVNPDHLDLLDGAGPGGIVANPNCCAIPLAMVLAPLHRRWGVEAVITSTWQAVSGAGYPGESAWDVVGNVHPHAGAEEEKLSVEPQKILGTPGTPAPFPISARCVRVPVADGHLLSAHIRLRGSPRADEVQAALEAWTGEAPPLPSSPRPLIHVDPRRDRPQPRLDVDAGGGMALTVGRVEPCAIFGVKLFVLGHNTIRGAAGAAIANAELLQATGRL